MSQKRVGKIAHVRVFEGTIKNRDSIYIPSGEKSQKVTQIRRAFGAKYTDIGEVCAGDIEVLCGLSSIQIGDIIGKRGNWSEYKLAVPLLKVQVLPQSNGELINQTLLEPMVTMLISAQEEFLGKVIGDLVQMRGEFDSPIIRAGAFKVEARIPVATSLEYPIKLGILTSGRGVVSMRFSGYKECPAELGASTKRRGVNPLDRAKWILNKRNALY